MEIKYRWWDNGGSYPNRDSAKGQISVHKTKDFIHYYLTKSGWLDDNPTRFKSYREAMSILYKLEGKVICTNYDTGRIKPRKCSR